MDGRLGSQSVNRQMSTNPVNCRFHLDYVSYIHMMSSTPHWAVVVVYPVSMDPSSLFEHNMHPIETIVQLNESTKFVLMDLKDGWRLIDSFID